MTLVDYDFARSQDTAFLARYGADDALHWFAEGFSGPQGKGIWTLGPRAEALVYLKGDNCTIDMTLSTHPGLSQLGQGVTVYFNDVKLEHVPLPRGWEAQRCSLSVSQELLCDGLNELALVPDVVSDEQSGLGAQETRPLGVFLREVQIACDLKRGQRKAWRELNEPPASESDWQIVPLPEKLARQTADSEPDQDKRPDLLIILLDAARSDHFSCYGYPRKTSPVIDNLAANSVVMKNMWSVSSFTLIATASLFTGRSWQDHQVIVKEDAMSDSLRTLAEILQENGYQTIGYSDNPHVSKGTRLDQGFAEFTEVWKHPRHKQMSHLSHKDEPDHVPGRLPEMV